jgi:hypothetical protein
MVFRGMRIGSLNLYEALGTYWLIATACLIEIWRVEHEANGALLGVLVQEGLDALPVHVGIFWQSQLLGGHVSLRGITRAGGKRRQCLCATSEEWR